MIPVAIVSKTVLDRSTFIPAAQQITGENHITEIDAQPGASIFLDDVRAVKSFSDMDIDLSTAVTYVGVLAAGFRDDIEDFLIYTRGMPYCPTNKCRRGTWAVFVSGSLDQWQRAIVDGCKSEGSVQAAYNSLYNQFVILGFSYLFQDYKYTSSGNSFSLVKK